LWVCVVECPVDSDFDSDSDVGTREEKKER